MINIMLCVSAGLSIFSIGWFAGWISAKIVFDFKHLVQKSQPPNSVNYGLGLLPCPNDLVDLGEESHFFNCGKRNAGIVVEENK